MAKDNITGIESVENVTAWIADRADVTGALDFDLVAHGRSNLTFVLTDEAGTKWVLRRPPTGHVLASAHDMGREHRIISALQGSPVPVPGVVGMCEDDSVNGAPFYVMEFVDGYIINDLAKAQPFTPDERRRQSESLVDVLAALHEVDPDEVGLGDLGRKEAYLERQLRRWKRQIDEGSDRDLPLFHELHTRLSERMPEQQGAGIAHGDYRFGNCMVDVGQGLLDLLTQIEQLQSEVRRLRGELENQAYTIEQLRKGQTDIYNNLDQRLGTIEQGGATIAAIPGQSAAGLTGAGAEPPLSTLSAPGAVSVAGQPADPSMSVAIENPVAANLPPVPAIKRETSPLAVVEGAGPAPMAPGRSAAGSGWTVSI